MFSTHGRISIGTQTRGVRSRRWEGVPGLGCGRSLDQKGGFVVSAVESAFGGESKDVGELWALHRGDEIHDISRQWVKGWEITPHKRFRKALGSPQVMASPLSRLVDDSFVQVVRELDIDGIEPSVFKKLLQLSTNHFDDGDQGRVFEQLNSFGVPSSTDLSTFLRAFKECVSLAQGTEKIF